MSLPGHPLLHMGSVAVPCQGQGPLALLGWTWLTATLLTTPDSLTCITLRPAAALPTNDRSLASAVGSAIADARQADIWVLQAG